MRGKSARRRPSNRGHTRFNEARALCAGSLGHMATVENLRVASMRPAHYAREVDALFGGNSELSKASMRPAHYAREVCTLHKNESIASPLQ